MFKRIKLLTLLQLSDRLKLKKIDNKKAIAARIGIMIFTLAIITVICSLLIYLL